MKTHRILIVVALLAIIAVLYLFLAKNKREPVAVAPPHEPTTQTTSAAAVSSPANSVQAQDQLLPVARNVTQNQGSREPEPGAVKRFMDAYLTPISFYGKVVNEQGNPILGASVKFNVADKPWQNSSTYERISDADGLFSIKGIAGASLAVFVSKPGYYPTEESRRGFAYGAPRGRDDSETPTSEKPAIFVLRKMGESVPLVHLGTKSVRVVEDGTPVEVDLATGAQNHGKGSAVRVEVWSDNPTYGAQGPYGWRARVTVPGGGLIERNYEFDFEAPADGYATSFETSMAQNAEHWRNGFERQFFAYLPDGRFARFTINLKTGGLFFTLESFINPTPGSRNLEFDPKQF